MKHAEQEGKEKAGHTSAIYEILHKSYRWHPELRWKIQPLIISFSQKCNILSGRLRIHHRGELVFGRCGEQIQADWYLLDDKKKISHVDAPVRDASLKIQNASQISIDALSEGKASLFIYPITHSNTELGLLEFTTTIHRNNEIYVQEFIQELVKECGHIIQRQQLEEWTKNSPDKKLSIVGASHSIHSVECFIEKATRSDLPVLIQGEFGTDKLSVAVSLHAMSCRQDAPFVEIRCSIPEETPEKWIAQADGGTLFLNEIDRLPLKWQVKLIRALTSRQNQWLKSTVKSDYRMVASSSANLNDLVRDGKFLQELLIELDFLSITIPPLRERKNDIQEMVNAALIRHCGNTNIQMTEETFNLLKNYAWPQNDFELERSIARLVVMSDSETITANLALRYIPHLVAESHPQHKNQDILNHDYKTLDINQSQLIEWMMGKQKNEPEFPHEGLRRAVIFLRDNYAREVTSGDLAKVALLSTSHLTYLFRTGLNTSFKSLLRRLRIEKAKELLINNPELQITQVARRVGFVDLSYFERSFKGLVQMPARKFRQQTVANLKEN